MSAEAKARRDRRKRSFGSGKALQLAPLVQLTQPCAECGHAPGLHPTGLIERCWFPECECRGFVEVTS